MDVLNFSFLVFLCSSICLCLFLLLTRERNLKERENIVHLDTYDESKWCCIIVSKTKFVRAFTKLQEEIRLSLCFLVLFLLFINHLQIIDKTFLFYLNLLLKWPPDFPFNIKQIVILIMISLDMSYIFIHVICRKAIYRKVGDNPILILFEVISFSSTFFYDGIPFIVVWIIPIVIYFLRVIITMFTYKQPNHKLILKNNQSQLNPGSPNPTYKTTTKNSKDSILKLPEFDRISIFPPTDDHQAIPPSFSIHASTNEFLYSTINLTSQNHQRESPPSSSYIFGSSSHSFLPSTQPHRTESSSSLSFRSSFGVPPYPEEKDCIKDDLISRFNTLNL